MKKTLVLLLSLIMVLALVAACAPAAPAEEAAAPAEEAAAPAEAEAAPAEEAPAEGKTLKFMLSNAYYTAPYCAAFNPAAAAKAEELGVELTILDANGNQQTALEHANQAIAEGYDGFIYFSADVDGALPVIEALNDSGIAWEGVNSYDAAKIDEVGMEYFVGADVNSFGEQMAQYILDNYPDGVKIAAIEGTAGHAQTVAVNGAFDAKLDDKFVFIDRQDCNFQAELAMTKMTDMLTSYGLASKGGEIELIISHDGGMLTGIISALEAAGFKPGDVDILAAGSNKVVYEAIKDGWVQATTTLDPTAEAALAVQTLYDIVSNPGSVAPGWIKVDTPVATADTADEFNWF